MPNMPDLTKAQIVAFVGAIVGLAAAFGLDVSQGLQDAIVQLVTALVVILPIADAVIRHGRSRALAPGGAASAGALISSDDLASIVTVPTEDDQGDAASEPAS